MAKRRRRSSRTPELPEILLGVIVLAAWLYSYVAHRDFFSVILCLLPVVLIGLATILIAWRIMRGIRRREREARLTSAWLWAMDALFPQRNVANLPASIISLDYTELELLCRNVYECLGYEAIRQGGAGDEGIDVCLKESGQVVAVVQCKQYTEPIKPNHVRELQGSRKRLKGILWSPSGYTEAARQWAQENYPEGLELLDKQDILDLVMQAYGFETSLQSPAPASAMPAPAPAPTLTSTAPILTLPAGKYINPQALPPFDESPHPKFTQPSAWPPMAVPTMTERLIRKLHLTNNQFMALCVMYIIGALGIFGLLVVLIIQAAGSR